MFKRYDVDFGKSDGIPEVSADEILAFNENNPTVRKIKLPKTTGQLKAEEMLGKFMRVIIDLMSDTPYMDMQKFIELFENHSISKKYGFKYKNYSQFMTYLISKDSNAEIVYEKGKPVIDADLTEKEIVPFNYEGGIQAFVEKEIKPYAPDAFADEKDAIVGYELSFTKYFYQPVQLRTLEEITADIRAVEAETDGLLDEIIGGAI